MAASQHTDSTAATAHVGAQRDVAGRIQRHEQNAPLTIGLHGRRILGAAAEGIYREAARHRAQHDAAAACGGQARLCTDRAQAQRIGLDQVDATGAGAGAQGAHLGFDRVRRQAQGTHALAGHQLELGGADIERAAIAVQDGASQGHELDAGAALHQTQRDVVGGRRQMDLAAAGIQGGSDHDGPKGVDLHIATGQRDAGLEHHLAGAADDQPPALQEVQAAGKAHHAIGMDHQIAGHRHGLAEGHILRAIDAQAFEFGGLCHGDGKRLDRAPSAAQHVAGRAETLTRPVTGTGAGQRDRCDRASRDHDGGQGPRAAAA